MLLEQIIALLHTSTMTAPDEVVDEKTRKAEAKLLLGLWRDKKPNISQEAFGAKYELGNQSNVGHYLHGRRPLNVKAAMAFADHLGCNIGKFSQRLSAYLSKPVSSVWPFPFPPSDWDALTEEARNIVLDAAEGAVERAKKSASGGSRTPPIKSGNGHG